MKCLFYSQKMLVISVVFWVAAILVVAALTKDHIKSTEKAAFKSGFESGMKQVETRQFAPCFEALVSVAGENRAAGLLEYYQQRDEKFLAVEKDGEHIVHRLPTRISYIDL
jgi:hypothetical protein